MLPNKKSQITLRAARSKDVPLLMRFDHGYTTDYVWQMDIREEDRSANINFRSIRLPRTMRVNFPRDPEVTLKDWKRFAVLIVAEVENTIEGYIALDYSPLPGVLHLADCVVTKYHRRQGVGTALMHGCLDWASQNHALRVMAEVQTKNDPGINFLRKHGFVHSGYNERYYLNNDIALYFMLSL